MIDSDLLEDDRTWSPSVLLTGLLTHEFVELYRYSDEGPPPDLPRVGGLFGEYAVTGWASAGSEVVQHEMIPVYWSNGKMASSGSIIGNGIAVAKSDDANSAYGDLSADSAAERREADALAASVAEEVGVDLFITERSYLHHLNWSLAKEVTFVLPDAALPIVSLYLRAQRQFLIHKVNHSSLTYNRGLFYWVGTRDLLPEAWRWFAGCVQHSKSVGDDRLLYIGQSAMERVDRALELRDQVHVALNQPQDNDIAQDARARSLTCCWPWTASAGGTRGV